MKESVVRNLQIEVLNLGREECASEQRPEDHATGMSADIDFHRPTAALIRSRIRSPRARRSAAFALPRRSVSRCRT